MFITIDIDQGLMELLQNTLISILAFNHAVMEYKNEPFGTIVAGLHLRVRFQQEITIHRNFFRSNSLASVFRSNYYIQKCTVQRH